MSGRRGGKRRSKGLEGIIPSFKQAQFANTFMELSLANAPIHEIAEKMSRGYLGQRRLGPAELRDVIAKIFAHGRGDPAFRTWYATREGDPEGSAIVAAADVGDGKPESVLERLGKVERERDGLVARVRDLNEQLQRQASAHRDALAAKLETETQDSIRRLTAERNDALRKKVDAEYALQKAEARIAKLEEDLAVLRRRPSVEAQKLAELETTRDGLGSQITRLRLRLEEVERDRDEKDVALRGAIARVSTLEAAQRRVATVVPIEAAKPKVGQESSPSRAVFDILDEAVRAGVMTEAEAFERLRRAK